MACTGTPDPCLGQGIGTCEPCGCVWEQEIHRCMTSPDDCNTHGNQSDCEDCGCTWEAEGTNIKINVGDVWKDASEIKINIGDVWKPVAEIWINIGDVWKRVF